MTSKVNAIFSLIECGMTELEIDGSGKPAYRKIYHAAYGIDNGDDMTRIHFSSEDIRRLIDELDTLADTRSEEEENAEEEDTNIKSIPNHEEII